MSAGGQVIRLWSETPSIQASFLLLGLQVILKVHGIYIGLYVLAARDLGTGLDSLLAYRSRRSIRVLVSVSTPAGCLQANCVIA